MYQYSCLSATICMFSFYVCLVQVNTYFVMAAVSFDSTYDFIRTVLLVMLTVCLNGCFSLEQPAESVFEYYPRWRSFIFALREFGGPDAVTWFLHGAIRNPRPVYLYKFNLPISTFSSVGVAIIIVEHTISPPNPWWREGMVVFYPTDCLPGDGSTKVHACMYPDI